MRLNSQKFVSFIEINWQYWRIWNLSEFKLYRVVELQVIKGIVDYILNILFYKYIMFHYVEDLVVVQVSMW